MRGGFPVGWKLQRCVVHSSSPKVLTFLVQVSLVIIGSGSKVSATRVHQLYQTREGGGFSIVAKGTVLTNWPGEA
jgi:hypothetical protein